MSKIEKYAKGLLVIALIVSILSFGFHIYNPLKELFGHRSNPLRVEDTPEYKKLDSVDHAKDVKIAVLEERARQDSIAYFEKENEKKQVRNDIVIKKKAYEESPEQEKDKLFWEAYNAEYKK